MSALHALAATELLALYRRGDASPVEVTRAVLAHVDRWEPHLKATYALDADKALAQARESEARWRRGEPHALDGVPVTIKENIATESQPVPLGSAATELVASTWDAPPAARMREAGAVLVAKTTMPDYGMLSSGTSSFHPLTRNPWHLACNPGGSSAGAGAAAAAGYGPLHIGTDIGGSIRLPACWCGVFGLKPSLGRIPIKPSYAGRVAGPMTRSVTDAALMLRTLVQPDWRDSMSLPPEPIDWLDLERDVKGLRIGLLRDAGWGLPVEREVLGAVDAAATAFGAAGARVDEVKPFTTREMAEGIERFWQLRLWLDLVALPAARRALALPFIVAWAERGATLTGEQVFRGQAQMQAMRDAAVAACQPYHAVLSPVTPVVSFPAEWPAPTNDPSRSLEHIGFTLPYNMSEQPACSVNAGYASNGMPIGLQIAGRRFDDLGVLRIARAFERMRPAQRAWPEPPG